MDQSGQNGTGSIGGTTGFYLAQKFRGGNMGEVEVMGRLGGPRGWVREGDVPPPAQSAGS